MKITIEVTKEELEELKEHQLFRMDWIMAGMDDKKPLDFLHQKILNAVEDTNV